MNGDIAITAKFDLKPPVADFNGTPTTITLAEAISFTDLSTMNPTSWLWDFGDGTTSALKNPTHKYGEVGTYTVKLTATNAGGTSTTTKTAYVVVQPYLKDVGTSAVYRNLQEAYNAASEGATIQIRDLILVESLNANSATTKNIIIEGGYNINYSVGTGITILKGSISSATGKLTVKNFNLQN
jgi:PKD repeat protein